MNYIKLFKDPDNKLQKAITNSYEFYNNDVNPRRNRERNFILQKYTTDIPIENTPIKIGEGSLLGTYGDSKLLDVERYYRESPISRINGQIIIPLNYNYFPIEDLSRIITRNISVEDYYQTRAFGNNTDNFYLFLQRLIGNHNMTFKEAKYLNDAYPSEIIIDENEKTIYYSNNMNKLSNKQAINRELRHYLYLLFIKDNKRNPKDLNEFDKYIILFDDLELLHILRHLNGSTEFYLHDIDKKVFDPSYDYDDFVTKPAEKIKLALIHVAQNNYQNSFDNQNIQYAKLGLKLNYINLFK